MAPEHTFKYHGCIDSQRDGDATFIYFLPDKRKTPAFFLVAIASSSSILCLRCKLVSGDLNKCRVNPKAASTGHCNQKEKKIFVFLILISLKPDYYLMEKGKG